MSKKKRNYRVTYDPNTRRTYQIPVDKNGHPLHPANPNRQLIDRLFDRLVQRMEETNCNYDIAFDPHTHNSKFLKVNSKTDFKKALHYIDDNQDELMFDFEYNNDIIQGALSQSNYYALKHAIKIAMMHGKNDPNNLGQTIDLLNDLLEQAYHNYPHRFVRLLLQSSIDLIYLSFYLPVEYAHSKRYNVKIVLQLFREIQDGYRQAKKSIWSNKIYQLITKTIKKPKNELMAMDKVYGYMVDNTKQIKAILTQRSQRDLDQYYHDEKISQHVNQLTMYLDDSLDSKNPAKTSKILHRISKIVDKHPEVIQDAFEGVMGACASYRPQDRTKRQTKQICQASLGFIRSNLQNLKRDKNVDEYNVIIDALSHDHRNMFYNLIYKPNQKQIVVPAKNQKQMQSNLKKLIKTTHKQQGKIVNKLIKSVN